MSGFVVVESLRGGAASTVTFGHHFDQVTICSDGTAAVRYAVDGTQATLASPGTIGAGAASEVVVAMPAGRSVVSLISAGSPTVSVTMGQKSVERPTHTPSYPHADWF